MALIGVWNFRGTNEHGGKTALADWEHVALNGRDVYIVFDSDVMQKRPVHGALVRLKGLLERRGARVKLIYLPTGDGATKQGVDDFLAAGHGVDDLLTLATTELKPAPKDHPQKSTRPEIEVTERWLRDISDDAKAALLAANDPPTLFMRGTVLARVNGDKIEALTNITLKSHLDRIADFVKITERGGELVSVPVRPPADLAPDLLGRLDLGLPQLDEVVNAPVFLPGGVLLAEDGYNAEHRLLLKLRGLSGLRFDLPVDEALGRLKAVFQDFPFVPTMSQPRDSDETEKRITAVLLEARPVVFWDNVTRLGSDPLHAALTSQTWQGRILGKSETVTVPNRAVWLASGNNVELSDEMTRRIIPIRLDAGVERPEERTGFAIKDLPAYVRENRSELVSACLSLVQAWVNEGMPKGSATLGRYESWAGVLGGILTVAGVPSFLSGRERLHAEADREATEWAGLCEAWWSAYGQRPVTAKDVFEIAKDRGLLLDVWGGRTQQGALQRIGHALAARRNRVFGGRKLVHAGRDGVTRNAAYRLEVPPHKTPETPKTPSDTPETPLETEGDERDLTGCFAEDPPETPGDADKTPGSTNPALDTKSSYEQTVSGVSGVFARPATRDDDLAHLVGATEGEL